MRKKLMKVIPSCAQGHISDVRLFLLFVIKKCIVKNIVDVEHLIALGATYKNLNKGDYVFHEGETCKYYYQLVDGRIRWINNNDQGKEFIQSMIAPGECFGELPLFDNLPYAASAVADSDSKVIRLPRAIFLQMINKDASLCFSFARLLAGRLRFKFMLLKEMVGYSPEHQVMALMNYFRSDIELPRQGRCLVKLTRQQIADMTGLRVETVIRAIKKLQKEDRLTIIKGKVYC
jgi:CRP-like cAMP-binding protein